MARIPTFFGCEAISLLFYLALNSPETKQIEKESGFPLRERENIERES